MARKAKVVEAVKGEAKAEKPVEPQTNTVAGDLDDMMAGTAVKAVAARKPAKKEVEDVTILDPKLKAKLALLLRYSAREKAAKARAEGLKGQLRPVFEQEYFKLAHSLKTFLKTVCINDACNYSAGNVGVAGAMGKDDAELRANFADLKAKLIELFGQEQYVKYIRSTSALRVNATPENVALLRSKLTPDEFAKVITYVPGLDVVTEEIGKETIVPLKRDMSVDPAVEAVAQGGGCEPADAEPWGYDASEECAGDSGGGASQGGAGEGPGCGCPCGWPGCWSGDGGCGRSGSDGCDEVGATGMGRIAIRALLLEQ